MENASQIVPKGTGKAAHSASSSNLPGHKSGPNGPNAGQGARSLRRQKAQQRAEAFKADGSDSPSVFSPVAPLAVNLLCSRNGAQETRPPSHASPPRSPDCGKRSTTANEAGQGQGDPLRRRGRTKEVEFRPAGLINRGRGMRAPDGLGPRSLMFGPISHVPRSEESRCRKNRVINAEIRPAGLISRGRGMRAPAGLSPPELTTEQAISTLQSEENPLEMGPGRPKT